MAASQEQKVDYLLKKIGYVSSKTGIAEDSGLSGTKKAPFAEPIPSPLVTPSTSIWADSTLVPSTPPNSNTTYVGIYGSGNAFQMTYDNTVSGNRSFVARTTAGDQSSAISGDWIDPSFGADYAVVVYRGDPNSGGVSLPAAGTGSNDTWFFDYSSGVLNFNGTVVPTGITTNNVYLVGYRYTGAKGVLPPAGEAQFSTLEVTTGISTFGGDLDVNANINSSGIITATTFSGTLENDLSLGVSGTGLSGSATYNNSSATTFTVTSNATSANTAETIVARDASGDFSAGTITASLTGTATTATNLADGANITTGTISDDRLPDLITSNINIASGISSVATLDATNATIDNLTFTSGTAITSVDTDLSSVSSSDDTLASAKAIKDYVDTQVTAQDLDFGGDSGTGSVDLDSQSFTISGTANQIVTSGSGTTLTVGLTDSVTVADLLTADNITLVGTGNTATITGPDNIVIDPATVGDNTGTVIILGDLRVDGETTTINSTTLTIDDKSIVLASGAADSAAANGAGIEVDGAGATFQYAHTGTKWVSNKDLQAESFIKNGGTSTEFLKADGSVDSNTYLTAESDTLDTVTTRGSTTTNNIGVGTITATKFVKDGGTSSEFLKADGSVDSNTYLTSFTETQTLDDVTTLGNTTTNNIDVGEVIADGLTVTGISTLTNQAEVRSDDGSQGRIDFYCEVNNAHYTRVQAAAHSDYSGNATVTLPSSSGTLLLTDGDGSSLTNVDATTLGGISSTSFLRSDAADIKTSGNLTFNDDISAVFGTSGEMVIKNDGTDNHITSKFDEDLNIELEPDGSNPKIYIRPTTTTQGITLGGGSGNPVELYHNNVKELFTVSGGINVTNKLLVGPSHVVLNSDGTASFAGIVTATSFVKASNSGGFLKADGTEDTSTYLTSFTETQTLDDVTTLGNTTTNNIGVGTITATEFVKSGGQSTEFLKADGSVDTNTYLTSFSETDTLDTVTTRGSTTTNNIDVGEVTSDGLNVTGISTLTNKAEIRSDDSTPGRIDFFCESNNAHYTRIQAAQHSEYSGNVTVTLPTIAGDVIVGDTASAITQNVNTSGIITAASFVKASNSGGFLKADGTEDTNTYLTSATLVETDTLDSVTTRGNTTNNSISVGDITATGIYIDSSDKLNLSRTGILQRSGDLTIETVGVGDNTGDDIIIKAHDDVEIQVAAGTTAIYATGGGSVKLNNNGFTRLETTGIGVSIVGTGNTATITGPSELVLDPAAVGDNTGKVVILGDLQIDGTTTTINSTTLTIDDKSIVVASGATDSAAANGAGIEVDGAGATFQYSHTGTKWVSNKDLQAEAFIKNGGSSTEFLKADGSVDSNTYLTSFSETDTLDSVTTRGSTTTNNIGVGTITATKFVKSGGQSTEFLKADGSVDTNTYLTSATLTETDTLDSVTTRGNTTNNSIGIGTTNPNEELHVLGAAVISSDAATLGENYSTLTIGDRPAGDGTASLTFKNNNNSFSGKIDGTSSGISIYGSKNSVNSNRFVWDGSASTENIQLKPRGQTVLYAQHDGTNGKVVIGSNTAIAAFTVDNATADAPCVLLSDTTNPRYAVGFGNQHVNGVGQRLDFYAGDSGANGNNLTSSHRRMSLTADGKLGIGTDAPDAKLEVRDDNSTGIIVRANSTQATDTNKALRVRNNSDTNTFHVSHKGQGYFAGDVGIGFTSPLGKLHVRAADECNFVVREESTSLILSAETNNGRDNNRLLTLEGAGLVINSGGNEKARITSAGDVGIGTDSPLAKLDVRGGSVYVPGGTFDASSLGSGNDSKTDAALVMDRSSAIYFQHNGYLRNLIEPADTVINIGQQNTSLISEINLKPGNADTNGVKLHHGGTADNVKLQTTGVGVTVTGDLIVSNNARVSGVLTVGQASVTINGTDNSIHGYDVLIAPPKKNSTVELAVTVATKTIEHRYYNQQSANGYLINGVEAPFLTLTPGRTYRFDQSDTSNSSHPLRFYREASNTATLYETNVTYGSSAPGQSGAYTQIVVTDDTPTVLHYQCSSHLLMGNSLQSNSISSSVVGVSSGTYGDGRYTPQITVNTEGKITSISAVEIFNNGLGSDLDLNSNNITGTGGVDIIGIVTATTFEGDATNMTGLTGVGAGTYGSANTIPVVTVASDGRIESISTVLASGGGGGGGGSAAVTRTVTSFTASANQTTFTVSYTVGTIDVFVNGSRLSAAEFTATNGTSVILTTGASVGDVVDVAAYASSLGMDIQNNGASVGTATTINFSTDLNVSMNGNTATVTSTASGGSGSGVSEELAIAYSIAL